MSEFLTFGLVEMASDVQMHSIANTFIGKKIEVVFDFLTYARETGFPFSYAEVECLNQANEPSIEIERASNLDNYLSFGAK